jgi:hypothetical protein
VLVIEGGMGAIWSIFVGRKSGMRKWSDKQPKFTEAAETGVSHMQMRIPAGNCVCALRERSERLIEVAGSGASIHVGYGDVGR